MQSLDVWLGCLISFENLQLWFPVGENCSPDHHRASTEGSMTYVELAFSQFMPVIHNSVRTIHVQLFSSLNIKFLHSEFQLMWFSVQSTRFAKWRSVIQGTALVFVHRRYGATCRTCWTRLTLIFNSMDLFDFGRLVIRLNAARKSLLLAF